MKKIYSLLSIEDKALRKLYPNEFKTWRGMTSRCNPIYSGKGSFYQRQGTLVCDRWIKSFKDFLKDMGSKPTPKHTIDRIKGAGNYEPSNCRWITQKEQCENIKSNRYIEKDKEKLTAASWSKKLKLHPSTVCKRIERGWSEEEALSESKRKRDLLEFNGEKLTVTQWARKYKIKPCTLRARLKDGWPLEKALKIKPRRVFAYFTAVKI